MLYVIVEETKQKATDQSIESSTIATAFIYNNIETVIARAIELSRVNNRAYSIYTLGQELT